jgi:hypothetical protein
LRQAASRAHPFIRRPRAAARERRRIAALFFDEVENIFPELADGLGRLSDT